METSLEYSQWQDDKNEPWIEIDEYRTQRSADRCRPQHSEPLLTQLRILVKERCHSHDVEESIIEAANVGEATNQGDGVEDDPVESQGCVLHLLVRH